MAWENPVIGDTFQIEENIDIVDFFTELAKKNPLKSICMNFSEFTRFVLSSQKEIPGIEIITNKEILVKGIYAKFFDSFIIMSRKVPPGRYALADTLDYVQILTMEAALG